MSRFNGFALLALLGVALFVGALIEGQYLVAGIGVTTFCAGAYRGFRWL
jgi:hypothetical protein